jgi:hypothetical protein
MAEHFKSCWNAVIFSLLFSPPKKNLWSEKGKKRQSEKEKHSQQHECDIFM